MDPISWALVGTWLKANLWRVLTWIAIPAFVIGCAWMLYHHGKTVQKAQDKSHEVALTSAAVGLKTQAVLQGGIAGVASDLHTKGSTNEQDTQRIYTTITNPSPDITEDMRARDYVAGLDQLRRHRQPTI